MTIEKPQIKLYTQGFLKRWLSGYCDFSLWCVKLIGEYFWYIGYRFVFKRVGKCKQCGKCCRHVYLRDRGKLVSTFDECLRMVKKKSSLRGFNAKGKNEDGEIYFACNYVGADNRCTIHKNRPYLCRAYPDLGMLRYGAVPKDDCGFYFVNRFTGRKVR